AYGLCVALRPCRDLLLPAFRDELALQAAYLERARPTAVNLGWALRRMQAFAESVYAATSADLYEVMVEEACRIHEEDIALCRGIGASGVELIADGIGVLTHCNAGALATAGIGTATAPMYLAHERGRSF